MGYNSDNYIITTLSSSVREHNFLEGAVVSPFSLGTRGIASLRRTCVPYTQLQGEFQSQVSGGFQFPVQYQRDECGTTDFEPRFSLIASGSRTLTPTMVIGGVTSSVATIASGSRTFTPTMVVHGVTSSVAIIASGSRTFTPTMVPGGVTSSVAIIASGSRAFTPTMVVHGVTSSVAIIASGSRTFTPESVEVEASDFYTQIVSSSNPNNTTPMHVGSIYLDAKTYTTIGAVFADIGPNGEDAHVEFKRFSNAYSLLSLSNTDGADFRFMTGSNVVVPASDWYDIYISASGNPATSSIRGIFYEV